jgi:hypothetical protein
MSRPVADNLCQRCKEITLDTLGASCHGHDATICEHIIRYRDQLDDSCPLCQLFLKYFRVNQSCSNDKVVIAAVDERVTEPATVIPWRVLAMFGRAHYFPLSRLCMTYSYQDLQGSYQDLQGFRRGEQRSERTFIHVTINHSQCSGPPHRLGRYIADLLIDATAEERFHVPVTAAENPQSESNLVLAQKWLHDCLDNHSSCHTGLSSRAFPDTAESSVHPVRLINVGSPPAVQPFLTETSGERGPYVALSYCWESAVPECPRVTLIKANKNHLEQQLPMGNLPPTICDAIDFTRRLGIQYIWIDRLCIVQDDPLDWARQAGLMCEIYEGAILTLAALATETADKGLYLPRTALHSVRVECSTKDKSIGTMNIGPELAGPLHYHLEMELNESRWTTRGWTLQERLLSRRILYFGRLQMYWECREDIWREDGVVEFSRVGVASHGLSGLTSELAAYKRAAASGVGADRHATLSHRVLLGLKQAFGRIQNQEMDYWRSIVRDFASRELTVSDDRLEALKGVARAIQLNLGWDPNTYSFGHFSSNAAHSLLWYSSGRLIKPKRPRGKTFQHPAYAIRTLRYRTPRVC